jgi:hypothetical protein
VLHIGEGGFALGVWPPTLSGFPSGKPGAVGNLTTWRSESKSFFSRQAIYLNGFFFRGEISFL